jgi:hypothetical protein
MKAPIFNRQSKGRGTRANGKRCIQVKVDALARCRSPTKMEGGNPNSLGIVGMYRGWVRYLVDGC